MTPKDALKYAKAKVGPDALAKGLGITRQAIDQWEECPIRRVLRVEAITGVPRHELRPDIYPAEQRAEAAA